MGTLEKLWLLRKIISQNGGLFKSLYKFWRFDTVKDGKYVGCDSFGNKYYENPYYMIGRSRWVEYNDRVKFEYDASQVTPEWYGWLHYRTDKLPCEDDAKLFLKCCCWSQSWLQPHQENTSGTAKAFYPYTTTRPHIHLWDEKAREQTFHLMLSDPVAHGHSTHIALVPCTYVPWMMDKIGYWIETVRNMFRNRMESYRKKKLVGKAIW